MVAVDMNEAVTERDRMVRFTAVSAAAGVLDYACAAALILLGLADLGALLIGMAVASGLSFIAHEFWTFRADRTSAAVGRLSRWIVLVIALLGLRYVVLQCAEAVLPQGQIYRLAALAAAFAVSLTTNYLASRFLVFARKP